MNENQNEQNYYGVVTYQKIGGRFEFSSFRCSGANSSVHFTPDPVGDLYFNGVASDVDRNLYSGGLQADASYDLSDKHTIRGGLMVLDESVVARLDHDGVSSWTAAGNPTGQTGISHRGQQYAPRHVLREFICRTNGKFTQAHGQLRRALRCFQFVV